MNSTRSQENSEALPRDAVTSQRDVRWSEPLKCFKATKTYADTFCVYLFSLNILPGEVTLRSFSARSEEMFGNSV